MAKQTPGSKCDTGSKYELSVTALFVSLLSKNENVEDYRIFSNLAEAQPFDDIVAEVQFKGLEQTQIYAIQVKSGKDNLNVNKYCHGYDKIMTEGGLKLGDSVRNDRISFWYFCSKSPTKKTFPMTRNADTVDLKLKPRCKPYNLHESVFDKAVSHELFSGDPNMTDHKHFFENFYLFFHQPDTQKLTYVIKGIWNIDNPSLMLLYLDNYFAKNLNGLDKATFEHEILKIRLSDYIVTPIAAIALQQTAADEWNRLTLKQDVTIVRNEINIEQYLFGFILQNISDVISVDEWNRAVDNVGKLDRDLKSRLKAKSFKADTLRELIVDAWVHRKTPLLLKTDTTLPLLKQFSHLKKSFIIIDSNVDKRYNEIKGYELSVFRHLGNVEAYKLMKSIPVSLQGRKPISLYEIIKEDRKVAKAVTCLDIVRLLKPREIYLKRECLDANEYMLFIIETPNVQQFSHNDQQPIGNNIAIYCEPGEIYRYHNNIRANPRFRSYKIFCLRLTDGNKLTLVPRTRDLDAVQGEEEYHGLECFFVDQYEESVYRMENGDIVPIIGEIPIHVRWKYIPRFLLENAETDKERSLNKDDSNKPSVEHAGSLLQEKDVLKGSNSKITVVTGEPGIGKTTLLHYVFRFCESKYYVLFLNLALHQVDLRNGKLKTFEDLLRLSRTKCHSLPYSCFLNSLHDYPDRLVLILDSFDETLATCKQQILEFIENLQTAGLQNMIIASRLTASDLLTQNFEVRTLKLEGLQQQSDEHYITNWNLDINKLRHIPSGLLTNPLYLNMLRTITENGVNLEVVNTWNLYETVVNLKMEDYCRRIEPYYLDENEKQSILTKHGELALKAVFGINKVTQKQVVQSNYSNFIRLGFITCYDNENPVFVHRTFVEFFVAKWLIQNTNHDDAAYIYTLMLDNDQGYILNIHSDAFPLHKAVLDKSLKDVENLCTENINCLLKTDDLGRSVLHLTTIRSTGFDSSGLRIVNFLIRRMREQGYDLHACDKILKWSWVDYFEKYKDETFDYLPSLTFREAYFNYYATHVEKAEDCTYLLSEGFNDLYDDAINYSSTSLLRDLLYIKYYEDETFLEFREMCLHLPIRTTEEVLGIHLGDEKLKGVHLACIHSNIEVVRVYVESGANLNEADIFNCTPLHYSVIAEQSNEIVTLLLQNCEILNLYAGQHNDTTILHMSIRNGNVDVTKMVLERINVNHHHKKCVTSPLSAIEFHANIDFAGTHDPSCFESIKMLMEKSDKQNYTPLALAVKYKQREMVEMVLQHGADPNYVKEELAVPLILTVENEDENTVQILLDHAADINIEDDCGITPLTRAISISRMTMVGLLLRNGAAVNYMNAFGQTTLTRAIYLNSGRDIIQMLLDYGADVNLKEKHGETPLCIAINAGNLEIIELLLRNGARIDCVDSSGWTPFIRAVQMKRNDIVRALLNINADVNFKGKHGVTPLCVAISLKDADTMQILLDHQADVNYVDEYGLSPLITAVETGSTQVAKILLENTGNVNFKNEYGITALFVAAFKTNVNMVELLLVYGADVNIVTSGEEIIHKAKDAKKIEIVLRLLKNRVPGHPVNRSNDSNEPNSIMNIIRKVTENWAGINLLDELRTAVMQELVNLNTIKNLMEWGGEIDIDDEFWAVVFRLIIEMNSEEVFDAFYGNINYDEVLKLIGKICSIESRNKNLDIISILSRNEEFCSELLQTCTQLNNKEVLQIVLQSTDVKDFSKFDYNPLCFAAREQNIEIVKMLLDHGCEVNEVPSGPTPLIIAVGLENMTIAEMLLANGADASFEVENSGLTALYVAALTENRSMVDMLLWNGAKKNIKTFGNSLRDEVNQMILFRVINISIYDASESMNKIKLIIEEQSRKIHRMKRKYKRNEDIAK